MKEEIVNQAIKLFLQYGFKSVTMDEIAQHMRISKKTIYAHFSNKVWLKKLHYLVLTTLWNLFILFQNRQRTQL